MTALEIFLEGRVQGVGFRPFVWQEARRRGVAGWVENSPQGVTVHAEAPWEILSPFLESIVGSAPFPAQVLSHRRESAQDLGCTGFAIRESALGGEHLGTFLPDLCLCDDCRRELLDPANRRHLHPFITCTRCGPRFSITRQLPYDRASTSLRDFPLCPDCRREYEDPTDRRFHAQPLGCHRCGPRMWCEAPSDAPGNPWREVPGNWLDTWTAHLESGGLSLLKGIGGFQLVCDAARPEAVRALRERKRRETKPFALLFPDLESVRAVCRVSPREELLLRGPDRPIVLLEVHTPPEAMDALAPGLGQLGAMLPHSPVHELLFSRHPGPVVLTSANPSHEPMLTGNDEVRRLARGWSDLLVLHDRDIVNRLDDGVVAAVPHAEQTISLRLGRGQGPVEFVWKEVAQVLATGADLKNAVALGHHGRVTLSQHVGDLESPASQEEARTLIGRLYEGHRVRPDLLACDAHPDFASSRLARELAREWDVPLVPVQHHHAHIAATWLEHRWEGPAVGLAMDGTGYGDPQCLWGSEALLYEAGGSVPMAHWEGLRLPGGDRAVREPVRLLVGALHDLGDAALLGRWLDGHPATRRLYEGGLGTMLASDLHCPASRGLGRLFDLVGAALGWEPPGWDGEYGTRLEGLDRDDLAPAWPIEVSKGQVLTEPILRSLVGEVLDGHSAGEIASRLHATACELIVRLGLLAQERLGADPLPWAFGGGVFQNRRLVSRLRRHPDLRNRTYHFPSLPNDNGIALGQVVVATALSREGRLPCA